MNVRVESLKRNVISQGGRGKLKLALKSVSLGICKRKRTIVINYEFVF